MKKKTKRHYKKTKKEESMNIEIKRQNEATAIVPVKTEKQESNIISVEAVVRQIALVKELYRRVLVEGVHYGKIPGVNKPSLYKPGAEQLMTMFKLVDKIEKEDIIDLGNGHREYRLTLGLYHKLTGQFWGQGIGSCSTMESKYRYRYNSYKKAKEENPNIADIYNTVYKMGFKRALVSAIISATGVSDIFTQDVEDMDIEKEKSMVDEASIIDKKYLIMELAEQKKDLLNDDQRKFIDDLKNNRINISMVQAVKVINDLKNMEVKK